MNQYPLISCICVLENAAPSLNRVVFCFERQDYPNKELIISCVENDVETKSAIEKLGEYYGIPIVVIGHPQQEKLKVTKNIAIDSANGTFICMWNANSWHHSNRLYYQYECIKTGSFLASMLMYIFVYDPYVEQSYYSCYRGWEETILCEKEYMVKACYRKTERGENLTISSFLQSRNLLLQLLEVPHLYAHILDEEKTESVRYRYYLFKMEQLDEETNDVIKDLINPINYRIL